MSEFVEISVIVPVFNRGSAVADTLESCFAQTGCRMEVTVEGDASTGGTPCSVAASSRESNAPDRVGYLGEESKRARFLGLFYARLRPGHVSTA